MSAGFNIHAYRRREEHIEVTGVTHEKKREEV